MVKTLIGKEAKESVLKGINILADAVQVTLGPKGNNVLIQGDYGDVTSTKDGVTVARAIDLRDPIEDMGAQLLRKGASKMVEEVGDGTTTVTVLTRALIKEGFKLTNSGHSSIDVKRRWLEEVPNICKYLQSVSVPLKDNSNLLKAVATISANNDEEIGELIASTFEQIGEDGGVKVLTSDKNRTEVEITNGATYENGYMTPHFVTNEQNMKAEYTDVKVLIINGRLTKSEFFFEALAVSKETPLLIICNEIDNESLSLAVLNAQQSGLKIVLVTSPGFGDARTNYLKDISLITNAIIVSTQKEMIELNGNIHSVLGHCDNILVSKDDFCLIGGSGLNAKTYVEHYIKNLKEQRELFEEKVDRDLMDKRIASLLGKIATIKVGAPTELEMKELKDRIDDAVSATSAALVEGVVVGGGQALYKYAVKHNNVDDPILKGLLAGLVIPAKTIADNAGLDLHNDLTKYFTVLTKEVNYGLNANTGEHCDLIKAGVVDPLKVTRVAVETAISIASTVLTTECIIYKDQNGK